MKEIAPNVFVETRYPGTNVGLIIASEGSVCIDAPTRPGDARDWIGQVFERIGGSLAYLILTDYQGERVMTAQAFQSPVVVQEATQAKLASYEARFPAPLLEAIGGRYDVTRREINGFAVAEPQISIGDEASLHLGDRQITLLHVPSATPGSLWVYLRDDKVLFTGDTLVLDEHPPLAEANTEAWLEALARASKATSSQSASSSPVGGRCATNQPSNLWRPISAVLARRSAACITPAGRGRTRQPWFKTSWRPSPRAMCRESGCKSGSRRDSTTFMTRSRRPLRREKRKSASLRANHRALPGYIHPANCRCLPLHRWDNPGIKSRLDLAPRP